MSEEEPTLAFKVAKEWVGDVPPPHLVARAQNKLLRTFGGFAVALVALAMPILVWWRTGDVPLLFMLVCMVAACFATGVMSSGTMLDLARIVLRREEKP